MSATVRVRSVETISVVVKQSLAKPLEDFDMLCSVVITGLVYSDDRIENKRPPTRGIQDLAEGRNNLLHNLESLSRENSCLG